jgi:hypothetical protein
MRRGYIPKQSIIRLEGDDPLDDMALKGSTYAIKQRSRSKDPDFNVDDIISEICIVGTEFNDV